MNAWSLARFQELRVSLKERGLLEAFLPELRRVVSPGGELSLFEAIDQSDPGQWREAVARVTDDGQRALPGEAAHE